MNIKNVIIVLLVFLCVAQTAFIFWIFDLGLQEISKEEKCVNICYNNDSESYMYQYGICYCYNGKEISHMEEV